MVGMLEAFELHCFAPKWLKNIAACSPGCLHSGCGGDHRWDHSIPQEPGRHLEMVPASNCPEVRNRHNNIVDTPAVNWLGNLTTDIAGVQAGTEPSRIRPRTTPVK